MENSPVVWGLAQDVGKHPGMSHVPLGVAPGCSWLRSFHRSVRAPRPATVQRSRSEPAPISQRSESRSLPRRCLFDVFVCFFVFKEGLGWQGGTIAVSLYTHYLCTWLYKIEHAHVSICTFVSVHIYICHMSYIYICLILHIETKTL